MHVQQLLEHMEEERGLLLLMSPQTPAMLALQIFGYALVLL